MPQSAGGPPAEGREDDEPGSVERSGTGVGTGHGDSRGVLLRAEEGSARFEIPTA